MRGRSTTWVTCTLTGAAWHGTCGGRSGITGARRGKQHERAMNLVGRCYEQGWGVARDAGAAADWYRRSAEGGYFRGQYNWATVLLRANRVEEAAIWFECAANGGTVGVRRAVLEW